MRRLLILFSSVFVLTACQNEELPDTEEQISSVNVDIEQNQDKVNVEEAINNIGKVELDSNQLIDQARNAFDNLDREQQKQVANLNILLDAEKNYEKKVVDSLQAIITGMTNLTFDDFTPIEELRLVYSKLSDKQLRQLPENIQNLEAFISSYKVNLLDKQINSVTYHSGEPNENQINNMITMLYNYNELNQNEIKSLANKEKFDDIIKSYKKYYKDRKKNDELYKRYDFINNSSYVSYEDIQKFPDSFKNQKIELDVEILEITKGNLITDDSYLVQSIENENDIYRLEDKREVKEPILFVKDQLKIYGEYKKLDDYIIYSDEKGLFGSNFNRQKLEEYQIPVIDLKYSDLDNLGVIAKNNPLLSVEINEELELLKNELYVLIEDIN